MTVALSSGELLKLLGYSSSSGAENEKGAAMTLEERLALAREIAARRGGQPSAYPLTRGHESGGRGTPMPGMS